MYGVGTAGYRTPHSYDLIIISSYLVDTFCADIPKMVFSRHDCSIAYYFDAVTCAAHGDDSYEISAYVVVDYT